MKKSIILLFVFSSILFSNVPAPKWFVQDEVNVFVYSYGKTINEAKINAKEKLEKKLNIISIDIKDFEIVKDELFELKHFIKVKYVNQDIYTQIENKLKTYAFKQAEQNNVFLKNTKFFKKLNNNFGYYPNIDLIDNNLYFNDEKFIIKKNEFKNFISEFNDKNITIGIKDELKNEEKFFIEVQTSYDGYATLAQVYNGNLNLFFKNKKINESIIFPNFKISDGYALYLDNNITINEITTIVTICENKKDLESYNMYFDDNNNALQFSDFINEMSDCKITSKNTKITKQ